jgi:serine/threonine-protein kinase
MAGIDWRTLSPLLDELIELEASARQARLDEIATQDPALAAELRRLLDLDRDNPEFLAESAVSEVLNHPMSGRMIGPYRLERAIGEGGMGQVWLAERADGMYERRVALKLLRPGFASVDLRQRFVREQQILARLAHAHIARLLDAGVTDDGQPYLALEYIQGEPITDYARRLGFTVYERLGLILQVCAAVSHAHASLVVHRDLKPSNILVTPAGDVRLLDFGIAKLLDTQTEGGDLTLPDARAFSLYYAAPEQLNGEPVGTMTDVYSLGVVLYELLTGLRPYRVDNDNETGWRTAILESDAIRPSQAVLRPQAMVAPGGETPAPDSWLSRVLAGDLDTIIIKALQKAPEQRYASVEALAQDLQRYLDGLPILARRASLAYRARKYLGRHGLALAGGLAVVVLLAGSLLVAVWQARQAIQEAQRAQAMQDFVIGLFEADSVGGRAMDLHDLLTAGVARAESELASEPVSQVAMFGLIARLFNNIGDHRDALGALDLQRGPLTALTGDERRLAAVDALIEHARALRGLGRTRECTELFDRDEMMIGRIDPASPLKRAELMSQQARCLRLVGEGSAARTLFETALALRQRHGSPIEQAESLTDLAAQHADAGRVDDAIAGMRQALVLLEAGQGLDSSLAVTVWRSLAVLYRERGDVDAAEGAARQALTTAQDRHGPQHPITAQSQRQLAAVLTDQGRLDEAESLVEEAWRTLDSRFGEQHPDVGLVMNTRAIIAFERGQFPLAEQRLRQTIDIWSRSANPVRLPGVLINLGRVLLAEGRPDEAEAEFRRALEMRRSYFGEDHATVGAAWRFIGEAQRASGRLAEAEQSLLTSVDLLKRHYGPYHPQCGAAELSLARVHWQMGRDEHADTAVQEVRLRFADDGVEARKLRWWSEAIQAEHECRTGATKDGRRRLEDVLNAMAGAWPASSLRREILAVFGQCWPVG